MKYITIVVDLNENVENYLSLFSVFGHVYNDWLNIVSINHCKENEEIILRLASIFKCRNFTIYYDFYLNKTNPYRDCFQENNKRGNVQIKKITHESFAGTIYCFTSLSHLFPFVNMLNANKYKIYYFSNTFLQLKNEPISEIKIISNYLDDGDSLIHNFKNIVVIPKNISFQLSEESPHLRKALKTISQNDEISLLLKRSKHLFPNDLKIYSKLCVSLLMFFIDAFDIKNITVEKEKGIFIPSKDGNNIKFATHIHKIEVLLEFFFERLFIKSESDQRMFKLSIKNRYTVVKILESEFKDAYFIEFGKEKKLPLSSYVYNKLGYYLVHIIKKGNGILTFEGQEYFLEEGDMFFIHPDKVYKFQSDLNDPCEYYWFAFKGSAIETIVDKTIFKQIPFFKNNNFMDMIVIIEKLCNMDFSLPLQEINLQKYLYTLINLLFEYSLLNKPKFDVSKVREYIDSNYKVITDINTLSLKFGFDRTYLFRNFKKEYGTGIKEYIISLRLNDAKKMLNNNNYSIKSVATLVGFNSYQNFYNAFKHKFGVSPEEYRQK